MSHKNWRCSGTLRDSNFECHEDDKGYLVIEANNEHRVEANYCPFCGTPSSKLKEIRESSNK
jgi:hypothetical protein